MPKRARGRVADRIFTVAAWTCGVVGLALPLWILGYLAFHGITHISWEFLSEAPRGFPLGSKGGIWPAIQGTLALVGGGLLIAFPCAVGGALYLSEYCRHPRMVRALTFAAEFLASVPALVFGLWGFAFFVLFCRLQISLRAGILTLAGEMFPVILLGSFASLQGADASAREAALSLGTSRIYAVRRILLRGAWPGILAATVLAAGHAAGSAAPVLFTASVYFSPSGLHPGLPVMTLPTHLYYLVSEGLSPDQAYATAFVLVAGLLLVNTSALALRRWGGRS